MNFPDIVLITEHWLRPGEIPFIQDYTPLSIFSRESSLRGGTLILIRSLNVSKYSFENIYKYDFLLKEFCFEFSLIYCKQNNLYIICIYRSPSSSVKEFIERLDSLLLEFSTSAKIILTGDLNINFTDKNSINTTLLVNVFTSFGLHMHVNSPTHIMRNTSTMIDYVCSNLDDVSCSVLNSGISDHEVVLSTFSICLGKLRAKRRYGRIFSRSNYDKFEQICRDKDWGCVLRSPDPISTYHATLVDIFQRSFPLRWIKSRQRKKRLWLTKGIKLSAANLRSLNNLKKNFTDEAFTSYCNRYRQVYRKVVKAAKSLYYANRLQSAKNLQKETWSIITDLRNKNSDCNVQEVGVEPDVLNEFFCGIAGRLSENLPSGIDPISFLNNFSIPNSFYFTPTDKDEVREALVGIDNKKACGCDGMSARVLSKLPDNAMTALAEAINNSWTRGIFPTCLKSAFVVPLHKGGELDKPTNFRPISLLPTLSKVIERVTKKRLCTFLSSHGIISSKQFGFQSLKGTQDAVFKFLESVYLHINDGRTAAAVFCDLSKAFDCVDHGILLSKLEIYGFRGVPLRWFASFLEGRKQRVVSSGVQSAELDVQCGVPQGSVLGPILFLLYVNDIVRVQISGEITLFADDTSVLWHSDNKALLRDVISSDLIRIKEWCNSNRLSLNVSKTGILGLRCEIGGIELESQPLQELTSVRFLGVLIDGNLKFESHILRLSKKLASGCFAIRLTCSELGPEIARSVYFAVFESHLRYGIAFWGCTSRYLLNVLVVLQKKAVRSIVNVSQRESCRPLFKEIKILTLISLFILETSSLIHKHVRGISGPMHQRDTRRVRDLRLPIPVSTLTKNSFIYNGRKIFNHLPASIKEITDLKTFKKSLKGLLMEKTYYTIDEFYSDSLES